MEFAVLYLVFSVMKRITTTEGSTLILRCPSSCSSYTRWEKSPLTDFHFTTYAEDNQINPSLVYL
jgi:hypothetical protein